MRIPFLLVILCTGCVASAPPSQFLAGYRCSPEVVLDAWTAGDKLQLRAAGAAYELARTPSASGVRWEGDGVTFHEKGEQAVFVRGGERLQCRVHGSVMRAIERGVDYRAVGQEPGWLLEISRGENMVLRYDYAQRTAAVPYIEPEQARDRRVFVNDRGEDRLEIVIENRPCSDVMSGQPYPDTVIVYFRNAGTQRVLKGCGRALPE